MKNALKILQILILVAGALFSTSCNPIEKEAQSASWLIVESVLGYTSDGKTAAFLQSDVRRLDTATQQYVVFSDTALISLRAALLDPSSPTGPSPYNNITLTSYSVTYLLPAGGGIPGVDVPQPITNALSSLLIPINSSKTISFPVVLDIAKLQAPLVGLGGTLNTLQAIAQIDFVGKDQTGHEVKAQGNLTIYFADYIDPTPPAVKKIGG